MFCHNCGTALEEGVKFCPNCGAPVAVAAAIEEPVVEEPTAPEPVYNAPEEPVYQQPEAPVYREPEPAAVVDPEMASRSNAILIFGIIGLVCSCSFYLSLLGIIFSAVARGKVKSFLASGGQLSGKAKVGSILSKVGLILGIVLFVLFVFWLIVMIATTAKDLGSSYSSYKFY